MNYPYFIFKEIDSRDKNIIVKKLPPVESHEQRVEKIIVPGRHGYLTDTDGTYEGQIKTLEAYYEGKDIQRLIEWLQGSGEVIFSNEPDKKYRAAIYNKIPLKKIISTFHSFVIIFDCQPFRYDIMNQKITIAIKPAAITNPGYYSEPIINVHGSGNITLTINGVDILLFNVNEYVTINSELKDCYKGTSLKNNDMAGLFPVFKPGQNTISWLGNVAKLEITPNWRWL